MAGWVILGNYNGGQYVACYTGFDEAPAKGVDVGGLGFRPRDDTRHVVVFPSKLAALRWGLRWARINVRKFANLNRDNFSLVEVEVTPA